MRNQNTDMNFQCSSLYGNFSIGVRFKVLITKNSLLFLLSWNPSGAVSQEHALQSNII